MIPKNNYSIIIEIIADTPPNKKKKRRKKKVKKNIALDSNPRPLDLASQLVPRDQHNISCEKWKIWEYISVIGLVNVRYSAV